MKNNATFAIVAIAAVAALLVATTTITTFANQAFAKGTHQVSNPVCINQEGECAVNSNQQSGHDNAASVFTTQSE